MAFEFSLISKVNGQAADLDNVEEELKTLGPDVKPYLKDKSSILQQVELYMKEAGGFRYWYDFIGRSIALYEEQFLGSELLKKKIQEYDERFPEEVSQYWLMPVLNYLEEHYTSTRGGSWHH